MKILISLIEPHGGNKLQVSGLMTQKAKELKHILNQWV